MNIYSWTQKSIRLLYILMWTVFIFAWIYLFGYWSQKKQQKSLNVLTWAQVIDADFLHDFEKEMGVKVNLGYYEHNEELYAKLAASPDHGYDLIMPSDHMVETMLKKDMLQPIDTTKLLFWDNVYPELKGLYFDTKNNFSVPYYWGFLGLGIDTRKLDISNDDISWDLIFKSNGQVDCISITNDSKELITLAAYYLFGRTDNLTDDEVEQIKKLLLQQKEWVSLYTDMRPDYALASGNCPIGIIFIQDLLKVMSEFESIQFVIPKEAKFLQVDSFVVPRESKKIELVYAFLNYVYSPEVLQKYVDRYEFMPPVNNVKLDHQNAQDFIPSETLFSNVVMFGNKISEKILYNIWLSLKA